MKNLYLLKMTSQSVNPSEDCSVIENESETENTALPQPKKRKISYTPVKCYLCEVQDNPKKMTSLAGCTKTRLREVA